MEDGTEARQVSEDAGGDGYFAEGAGSSGDRILCITGVGIFFLFPQPWDSGGFSALI